MSRAQLAVMPERLLPHSAESERAILGAIILDNGLADQAIELLSPDDFYVRPHYHVFRAMTALRERGAEINPILLGEELRRAGVLEQVGGMTFFSDLTYGLPHLTDISHYAKIVLDKSLSRQLAKVANKVFREALEEEEEAQVVLDRARSSILQLAAGREPPAPGALRLPVLGGAALRGPIGDFVRLVGPHTEADPAALLVQSLVAYGNCVNRSPYFLIESAPHYCNLFVVVVGATGSGRKGVSLGYVKSLFERVDEGWSRDRVISGLASGEGLIDCVGDAVEVTRPIKEKGRATGEYETAVVREGVMDKRALVVESEFARTLRAQGRDGNTLSAVLRQAWDGDSLRTLTVSTPRRATNPHVSIIAHITAEELHSRLDSVDQSNGYANRFLWVFSRRSQFLPEGGRAQDENYDDIVRRLSNAISFARRTGEVVRDDEVRELWRSVYPDLAARPPGFFGSLTARAAPLVARLSMIYALLDESKVIGRPHLEAALELWRYCENSVRYVFGERTGDRLADEILRALREAGPAGLTRTEINNRLGGHRKSGEIDRALAVLNEARLAVDRSEVTGGRARTRWFAATFSAEKAE